MNPIIINNKDIIDFYNNNTHLNIETINLSFINIIKELGSDISKTLNNTLLGEIFSNVKDIQNNISSLSDNIFIKISQNNIQFLDNIKLILNYNSSSNFEKLTSLSNNYIKEFISNINTIIPNCNKELINTLDSNIKQEIQKSITNLSNNNNNKEFLSTIENKIISMQQPIFNFINTQNESISKKLTSINDDKNNIHKIMNDLNSYLNKYQNNSSFKGNISEQKLSDILNKLYKNANITDSRHNKTAGDFILSRNNKDDILIENKYYESQHVPSEEITKFIRDCISQNMHGLMISQKTGISKKDNFQIDIQDGIILVYITYVDYNSDIISAGIDIIDNLSPRIKEIENNNQDGIIIEKDMLDKFNQEYQTFLNKKLIAINNLKENYKKTLQDIENLSTPNISLYLNTKYNYLPNNLHNCPLCDMVFPTIKALNGHKNAHLKKKKNNET